MIIIYCCCCYFFWYGSRLCMVAYKSRSEVSLCTLLESRIRNKIMMLCLIQFQKFQTHENYIHLQWVLLLLVYVADLIFLQPFFPQAVCKWWAVMCSFCYSFAWKALINSVNTALWLPSVFWMLKLMLLKRSKLFIYFDFSIYLVLFL